MVTIFQYIGLIVLFLVGTYLYFLSFYIELKILRYRNKRYSECEGTKSENCEINSKHSRAVTQIKHTHTTSQGNKHQNKKDKTNYDKSDSDVTYGLFKLLQPFYSPLFDGIIDRLIWRCQPKANLTSIFSTYPARV